MPHITLETIARQLGVSKMTVSNAYNRPDQLSPALRQRVLQQAREIGYPGPNPLASTLRKGKTGTIGLTFDDPLTYAFTDPAAVVFMQGMAQECEQAGVGLLLVPGAPDRGQTLELLKTSLVDSFAVYSDYELDERIDVLQERGLPFVLIDSTPLAGVSWVGIDDRGGARLAAQHLLDLGHRRFGVVTLCVGPDSVRGRVTPERLAQRGYYVTKQRLAGYRDALEAAGIDWSSVPVYEHDHLPSTTVNVTSRTDDGYRLAPALLDRAQRPTAILAMSDELARGVMQAASERGIDVPRELSVVGFDDTPEAVRSRPPLTTVHQPLRDKGAAAARLLLDPRRVKANESSSQRSSSCGLAPRPPSHRRQPPMSFLAYLAAQQLVHRFSTEQFDVEPQPIDEEPIVRSRMDSVRLSVADVLRRTADRVEPVA